MTRKHQEGFVSLPVIIVFTLIAVILVTIQTMRTTFMAREVNRDALEMQARWLANSAVELAVREVQFASETLEKEQQYSRELAPIYIGEDPFEIRSEEFEDSRIKLATYGYTIQTMKMANWPDRVDPLENAYQILGKAKIPHRDYQIEAECWKLCWKNEAGIWKTVPVAK